MHLPSHVSLPPSLSENRTNIVPRILILTASFGEGHNAAAKGLRMALEERERLSLGLFAETKLIDLCTEAYPRLTRLARWGYLNAIHHAPKFWERVFNLFDGGNFLEERLQALSAIKNRLKQIIDEFAPHAVVSTFPFYNQIIDALYPLENSVPFLRFTIVTDSIRINSTWARGHSDFFIVPNRLTLEALGEHGIPHSTIFDLGFPVSLKFANCQIPRSEPPQWRIIYIPGGPWKNIEGNIRELLRFPQVDLTLLSGKDLSMYKALRNLSNKLSSTLNVVKWVDDMPERLLSTHLFIGKAGGAIVQECMAAGCPMIISQVVPGQEEGNVALIKQHNIGDVTESPEELRALLTKLMENEALLFRSWKNHLLPLQRPLAAQTIARFVLASCHPEMIQSLPGDLLRIHKKQHETLEQI